MNLTLVSRVILLQRKSIFTFYVSPFPTRHESHAVSLSFSIFYSIKLREISKTNLFLRCVCWLYFFFGVAFNLSCSIKKQHTHWVERRRETKWKGFNDSLFEITQSREHRVNGGKFSITFSVLVNYKLHHQRCTQFRIFSIQCGKN